MDSAPAGQNISPDALADHGNSDTSNQMFVYATDRCAVQAENTFEKKQISVIMETWTKKRKAYSLQVYSHKILIDSYFPVSLGFNILSYKKSS